MRDMWGVTVALLISLLFMASLMKLENGAHQDTIHLAVAQQAQTLEKAAASYKRVDPGGFTRSPSQNCT